MLSLHRYALILGVALVLAAPIKANAASVTIDLLLPLFAEDYSGGTDPFVGSEPASAEISITFDDATPASFSGGDELSSLSRFDDAVSAYSIVIRDSADTSGSTLASFFASGGSVGDINIATNFSTPSLGDADFITIFLEPALADSATGALDDFDLLSVAAIFSVGTLPSTGLENVTQATIDAAFQAPNLPFESDTIFSFLSFAPALSLSASRDTATFNQNDQIVFTREDILFGNDITAVPLPPAGLMLFAGIVGFFGMRRRC